MKYLKTYEGLFGFFDKKSEDDKIVINYINRLKKVKGISPYDIELIEPGTLLTGYKIIFDDTPIRIFRAFTADGFIVDSISLLKGRGFSQKNNSEFYLLEIQCEGEWIKSTGSVKYLNQLYDISESVYIADENEKRLDKIKGSFNSAADLIEESKTPLVDHNILLLKELLLDIEDNDFRIVIDSWRGNYGQVYDIQILKRYSNTTFGPYCWGDVSETIVNMLHYLDDMGLEFDFLSSGWKIYHTLGEISQLVPEMRLTQINILLGST